LEEEFRRKNSEFGKRNRLKSERRMLVLSSSFDEVPGSAALIL